LDLKPLFILILVALLLTPGCLSDNDTITPPFTTGQFVAKATDLNYVDWKQGDYNNMVLVFDGNKISVADANDLNVALPDLSGYVPYQGANKDVDLGANDLTLANLNINNYLLAVNGTAGVMGKYTYEMGSFERDNDAKLGVYSSASSGSNANSALTFGATRVQASSTYPGFELQYVFSSTLADNVMRYNFLRRNSTGTVTGYTANAFMVYGDGRVSMTPVVSGMTANPKFGINVTPTRDLHISTSSSTTPKVLLNESSTGDSALEFSISGDSYTIGIDNSDSDKFKIAYSSTAGNARLGTNDMVQIDSSGNVYIPNDLNLFFGAGNDASIGYDGTNLVVNPKEVGSGILDIQGTLQADGYNSSDGSAGITTTFVDGNGNIIGVKDGLIVSKTAP
jgi:hypothetical protein